MANESTLVLLAQLEELTKKNFELREEVRRLKLENRDLRQAKLDSRICHEEKLVTPVAVDRPAQESPVCRLSPKDKVRLFMSLFRGRDDVYARRWTNKLGRSGYSPAVEGGYYSRDKSDHNYLPLTAQVVEDHLIGKHIIGVYPLLRDDTCAFLAVDFDKDGYEDDAIAFRAACDAEGVSSYLERSRSGNGAHVWIFFSEMVEARDARKLGFYLLTRAMDVRHQLRLSSYDRLFPNQDTLPKGGFGNLIALPLQKSARARGGSVFVDDTFGVINDQWGLLSSVVKVSRKEVATIVDKAECSGGVVGLALPQSESEKEDPWTLPPSRKRKPAALEGPFPKEVRVVRANQVFIDMRTLPSPLISRLKRLAAFQNPEFFKLQRMRLPIYNKPRVISCSESFGDYLGLPRGCFDEASQLLSSCGIDIQCEDQRMKGVEIAVTFQGRLRDAQKDAVEKIISSEIGILSAGTAFGKTVVALYLIAQRKRNTLILVHRRQLIDQWKERITTFLGLPPKSIGTYGGGSKRISNIVDVATIQSLVAKEGVSDLVGNYGHVIIDECHHVSAFSFERVLKEVKAQFVLGVTATPKRKDGHHPIIVMQCGPILHRVSDSQEAKHRKFEHVVICRDTSFTLSRCEQEKPTINQVYAEMISSVPRNELILSDIISALEQGRHPLVLTERVEHLEMFDRTLRESNFKVITLRGGMGKKQRAEVQKKLAEKDRQRTVLIATGRYIGEGFDDSYLDTLFLTMPISWVGTLQQYVGRLHRTHDEKKVVQVYDYFDKHVPMLVRMYKKRKKGYQSMGYSFADATDLAPNISSSDILRDLLQ